MDEKKKKSNQGSISKDDKNNDICFNTIFNKYFKS